MSRPLFIMTTSLYNRLAVLPLPNDPIDLTSLTITIQLALLEERVEDSRGSELYPTQAGESPLHGFTGPMDTFA